MSADVSGRFGPSDSRFARSLTRLLFGRILTKAINLVPTESVYCSSGPGFLSSIRKPSSNVPAKLLRGLLANTRWQNPFQQLTLWGLTLGDLT